MYWSIKGNIVNCTSKSIWILQGVTKFFVNKAFFPWLLSRSFSLYFSSSRWIDGQWFSVEVYTSNIY